MGPLQLRDESNTGSHTELGGVSDAAKVYLVNPAGDVPGFADMLFTDDTGVLFFYRDSGATPPVLAAYRITNNAAYTVGANPRPYVQTVTANAGTDLDTSALALETGGNLELLLASMMRAGSHVYTYNGSNLMLTDVWTLDGVVRTKTYTYTGSNRMTESDWVVSP